MAGGDNEKHHEDGVWKNWAEGNQRASNPASTKAEPQAAGREVAIDRGVEHVIKKMDGTIGEKTPIPRL